MFRFTIRDVLWLMVVVAVVVTWQLQHANDTRIMEKQRLVWASQRRELEGQLTANREQVTALTQHLKQYLPPESASTDNLP